MKIYWKGMLPGLGAVLAVAALLGLFGPGPAAAYVYFITSAGVRQHWEKSAMPIPWSLNQGNSDNLSPTALINAFAQCFSAWDILSQADFSFKYVGTTTLSQLSGSDNTDLLIFDSQPIAYSTGLFTVSNNVSPSVVAVTINTYYVSSGNVADADIVFNDMKYTFSTTDKTDLAHQRINLQDVATHEIGHLLGLDHTFLEQGTMYPYARDGQSTLEPDDIAGISNLYPNSLFRATTDSIYGQVRNKDGLPVWGIYVTAINGATGEESVAAITDSLGRYEIAGLAPSLAYYLRAQTVDLDRLLGLVKENGDRTVYIPQYYDQAYRLEEAQAVTPAVSFAGYDFNLGVATILARYDRNPDYSITVLHFGNNTSSSNYMAVRFPKESLPASFNVFGMTFYNNDASAAWPKILLTSGTDTQPDLTAYIRQTLNYQGTTQGSSSVEWELAPLTNSRVLWVVFQFPDNKPFVTFGDGPAIGAVTEGTFYNSLFYSGNGGQSFSPYPTTPKSYNLQVYLTAELSDAVPAPLAQFDATALKFGVVKIGTRKEFALPISNTGTADLTLSQFITNKLGIFALTPDATVIPAGSTDTLRAVFTPKGTFTYSGNLQFQTNDATRTVIDIPVSGTGAYPAFRVDPLALDFGQVAVGSSAQKQFQVFSTGQVDLKVSRFNITSSHFSGPADSAGIAAGDSAAFTVTFAPQSGGALTGALTFHTDNPLDSLVSVSLSGTGLGGTAAGNCDFTGDGGSDLNDLLAFLLLVRSSPADPRLDWNGDGVYTISDALGLLLDIRAGKCSSSGLAASSGPSGLGNNWLISLDNTDLLFLETAIKQLSLDRDTEQELLEALYSAAGRNLTPLPRAFALAQNYPNPFNPVTAISFSVPEEAANVVISLRVFDIRGALVRTLVDQAVQPGEHTVFWDGTADNGGALPSGVYIYRLAAGPGAGKIFTRKMVLLK